MSELTNYLGTGAGAIATAAGIRIRPDAFVGFPTPAEVQAARFADCAGSNAAGIPNYLLTAPGYCAGAPGFDAAGLPIADYGAFNNETALRRRSDEDKAKAVAALLILVILSLLGA